MKSRKAIAVFTAILMTISTVVSCTGKGENGANNGVQSNSQSEVSSISSSSTVSIPSFTVSFDSNGGSGVASITVEKWDVVDKPEDPVKEGYIFAGWYIGNTLYDFTARVTTNIALKAQWRKFGIDFNLHKNEPLVLGEYFDGEITKAVLDDIDITLDILGGKIAYEKVASYGLGVHTFALETSEKAYTLDMTIASYVISDTASFLEYYEEVQNTKVSKNGQILDTDLYVVVANDFTYEGDGVNIWPAFNDGVMNGVQVGVFDGRGHIIKGLKTPHYTLFSVIQGTIKNVAFVDFEACGTRRHGVLARFIWNGRLENLYISGTALNGNADIIAGGMTFEGNAPVIKNCVFNVDFGFTQGTVFYNDGVGEERQTTFENVYAISNMKSALVKDGGGWEVFPYADVEFFGFVEMNMQNSLFYGEDDHLYFNHKKLF